DVPLTIENVILRSVNSHTQGELPVTLEAGEQYSVLLRLEESFLSHQAPRWNATRDISEARGPKSGGQLGRRDTRHTQSGKTVLPLCLKWSIEDSSGPAVWSQFGAECQLSTRTPLQVTLSCFSEPPGLQTLVTAVLSVVNGENFEVDLLALLPRDVLFEQTQSLYHTPGENREREENADEPPALIPLSSKKDLGRIAPGGSQSVYLQFLATRSGAHLLPPILLLDKRNNRKILARGGQVIVAQ
ncbi:TRAPP trafficking subunit Trs65, partial [Toxoplasma gondii TgCatPRC2]